MSYLQDKSTHIYYNARFQPKENKREEAVFSVNRVQNILDKADDYELAVIRFSIPTTSIPLIIFEDNLYSVSLKIGTSEYTEYLSWIPTSAVYTEKMIYSVQTLVDFINTAFSTAFSNLSGSHTITSTQPPFMTFSGETNLLTLNVPQDYLADGINVYANEELYLKINTFQDFYYQTPQQGQLNYEFVIKDLFDNTATYNAVNYFTSTQQYGTISAISDIRAIQFLTTTIPVNRELQGAQKNITSNFLTDFEPTQSNTFEGGGILQYYPQGPLRYIDLLSKHSLYKIDLFVKWVSKKGDVYPLYLEGEQSGTIKLLFRKKQNLLLKEFVEECIEDKLEELNIK